ncbi:MAG: DUF948 domain-containing protein [candidate division NC10 bacterium]|nr:DUF948 domain-containing protein [candidate division NC10 bacterium]MBI4840889.1 DUF948 domain-containing protein [candidate division NC10 bacterium]
MNPLAVAALVVLAVVSVVWTALLIPVLLEFKRASWRLQEFIRTLELDLRPVLHEAREGIREMTKAAQGVAESTARLRGAMAAMEEAGENLRVTTGAIRAVFGSRLIPVASVLAGVRAGVKTLWKRYRQRRESS